MKQQPSSTYLRAAFVLVVLALQSMTVLGVFFYFQYTVQRSTTPPSWVPLWLFHWLFGLVVFPVQFQTVLYALLIFSVSCGLGAAYLAWYGFAERQKL